METTTGKITLRNNDLMLVTADGVAYPINNTSLGGRSYDIGEEVKGVLVNGKLNICREYTHERKGPLYGYISMDDVSDEWITITLMQKTKPKRLSPTDPDVKRYKDEYEAWEPITVRRELITNY